MSTEQVSPWRADSYSCSVGQEIICFWRVQRFVTILQNPEAAESILRPIFLRFLHFIISTFIIGTSLEIMRYKSEFHHSYSIFAHLIDTDLMILTKCGCNNTLEAQEAYWWPVVKNSVKTLNFHNSAKLLYRKSFLWPSVVHSSSVWTLRNNSFTDNALLVALFCEVWDWGYRRCTGILASFQGTAAV
jgi:hypothetical protein